MSDPTTAPYRIVTFKADEVANAVWTTMMAFMYPNDGARKEAGTQAIEALYHAAFKSMEWVDPAVPLPPVKPVDLSAQPQ